MFSTAVVAALLALAGAQAHGARPRAAARRVGRPQPPNIVLILTDDQRFDTLERMPNVERLLAAPRRHLHERVRHHVGVLPVARVDPVRPVRARPASSRTSAHAGYTQFDEASNLATWLHAAGYDTALVGKYLNDYTFYGHHRVPPGWSDWEAIDSRPEERYYDYTLNENGRLVHYGAAP